MWYYSVAGIPLPLTTLRYSSFVIDLKPITSDMHDDSFPCKAVIENKPTYPTMKNWKDPCSLVSFYVKLTETRGLTN